MKERKHRNPSTAAGYSMAILGHELDNVLNGMLGMTRLLRETGLSAEQDRWSRAIEHSGHQLRRIVSAFRAGDAVREESTGGTHGVRSEHTGCHDLEPIDGIDLLEQTVISHAPLAARRRNRMLLTVDPAVPQDWLGDACRLRQLLDNLLGNANKFTTGGEIVLRAACGPAGADDAKRILHLSVSDSGPGVDPAAVSRIFDAGEQESERTRLAYGGSGLGLFVCREAVRAMGGTIALSSPPGGGASFEVSLPGLLPAGKPAPLLPSGILRPLVCHLDLGGTLHSSVAGWLRRLGVRCQRAKGDQMPGTSRRLAIRVSELQGGPEPAPCLLFVPLDGRPEAESARRLPAPIVGSSLGPVLLELVLEWLWLRDETPDSTL